MRFSMSMMALLIAFLLAASGCAPPSGEAPPPETPPAETPPVTEPIDPLGTSWRVLGFNDGQGDLDSAPQKEIVDVTFTEDGTIAGSSGCNRYTGSYEIAGPAIAIGPLASTRKICPGEHIMTQEATFLTALATAATWVIEGSQMELHRSDGEVAVGLASLVSGTVDFRTPRALPQDTEFRVTLEDLSRADAPAVVLGERVLPTAGRRVPLQFRIAFDQAVIDPSHRYGLRATISRGAKPVFTSTESYPVITQGAPRYDVEILLDPAGP